MRAVHTLALVPVIMVLLGPFYLNRVTPYVMGMPFLLSWLAFSLVLTSVVMAIIYYSDRRAESANQDGSTQ